MNDLSPGKVCYQFVEKLFPICRSITGNGVRQTLDVISEVIPLAVSEIPSGTAAYDWEVPDEWNVTDAYVIDEAGNKVIDFCESNLHLVSYSIPIDITLSLEELKKHIHTLPDQPDAIPYRTTYYDRSWGFCMRHRDYLKLPEGQYRVVIKSSLGPGSLTYGEYLIPGDTAEEVLLSAHVCHPSLANDNLSGIAILSYLAKQIRNEKRRLSYRFIFAPGTIGSIVWLSRNEDKIDNIKHGMCVSCVGDNGGPVYKRSRQGIAAIDRAVEHVFKYYLEKGVVKDFSPYGYDERQYCSPGFNLPVGLFERSQYAEFPEYHNSQDDLSFVSPEALADSYQMLISILDVLENDIKYLNTNPKCEPQLGRRGLYNAIGGNSQRQQLQMAMLWVLNLSDGENSLLDIASRAYIRFDCIKDAADLLKQHGLLVVCE